MLHACARRGLHPVFRLQANASGLVRDFIQSDDADRTVPVEPTQTAPQQQPDAVLQPVPARFVNYTAGGNDYTLATTLLDRKRYSRHALADLSTMRAGAWKNTTSSSTDCCAWSPFTASPRTWCCSNCGLASRSSR